MAVSGWQPAPEQIRQEQDALAQAYGSKADSVPDGYEPFLNDCAKIAVFLKNDDAIIKQLKRLNVLLLEEAKKQGLQVNGPIPYGYVQHKKVLRNVLERELEKLGFQPDFGKAKGFLPPAIFRATLTAGMIVKDPGVSVEHGEFTHAIQWLLIGWQQAETAFLGKPVIDIFKQLGDERSVYFRSGDKEKNLWDLIIDRETREDSRTPEYLHSLMRNSDDPELSLLQVLCNERAKKRKLTDQQPSQLFADKQTKHKEYDASNKDKSLFVPRKNR